MVVSMIGLLLAGQATGRAIGAEILVGRLVLQMKNHAPDEVGGEAAQEQHDQDGQALPECGGAVLEGQVSLIGLAAARP